VKECRSRWTPYPINKLNAFEHPLVVDGLLAGYWTRRVSGAKTRVEVVVRVPLSPKQRTAVSAAADRLVKFSGEGCSLVALRT